MRDELTHLGELLEKLLSLKHELRAIEQEEALTLRAVHPEHLTSATNLVHYLGLRRHDVRDLQLLLSEAGLSSLGRSESRVLDNIDAVIHLLSLALNQDGKNDGQDEIAPSLRNKKILDSNTDKLFGASSSQRRVRIMVTLPTEAADDYALVKEMLASGMDCARINCAHDSPEIWERMVGQVKKGRRETGHHCRILMDLGGPKLRTGSIEPGPPVLKWRPQRDEFGNVISPARIWLHPEDHAYYCPVPADACLPVLGDILDRSEMNDAIEFTDARGAVRQIRLISRHGKGIWAEATQTAYVVPGIEMHLKRISTSGHPKAVGNPGYVGDVPRTTQPIVVNKGDLLVITRDSLPGLPARYDDKGKLIHPASISCSIPEIFECVKPGERIFIDDGKVSGIIRHVSRNELQVEIIRAREGGEKLHEDKGINLPDSDLKLDGLTAQDIENLPFVAQHADLVGLSFVRNPEDIMGLQARLHELKADHLGIVIKVETRAGFENLPRLLFTLMKSRNVGVMIARGDLAVECGYERLAELQEEIMWLSESAHIPVIWATQVLEELTKTGRPSRAEITDAAMGERAECVMLNKGPHVIEAIETLSDILQRMEGHQQKKRALMRRLHW